MTTGSVLLVGPPLGFSPSGNKWKMGKCGTWGKVRDPGYSNPPPPPFQIIKVQPPPPPDTQEIHFKKMGIKVQYPPPHTHRDTGTSLQENGGLGKICVHVCMFALLSLAAVGKVSKPRRGHPPVES